MIELDNDSLVVFSELKKNNNELFVRDVVRITNLDQSAIMRAALYLSSKGLSDIVEKKEVKVRILKDGALYAKNLLPELQVLKLLQKEKKLDLTTVQERLNFTQKEFKIAVGWVMRQKWVQIQKDNKNIITLTQDGENIDIETFPSQLFLKKTAEKKELILSSEDIDSKTIDAFKKRENLVSISEKIERKLVLTKSGVKLSLDRYTKKQKITQLTSELIKTDQWKNLEFKEYNIFDEVAKSHPGKLHPLEYMRNRIRDIFIEMGFVETEGPLVESSFWNFDALFQPQDHPARDLADTFYLSDFEIECENKKVLENVKKTHQNGWKTGSTGWGYTWDEDLSKKPLLRTHTTAVSARNLQYFKAPAKVFSIGKTFRNETLDYKHLTEFHQVEGIVIDESVNFSNLLGYLKEFYMRLGFKKIRVRPAYFPYTYCSIEPEVFFEEREEWIELGGAGIFRPEVTYPFGIDCPVLAWGLSLERPTMLMLEMNDIRDFYKNDLSWLRRFKPASLHPK